MSKLNLKADALAAYDHATAHPELADWRSVAELLRACLPTPKAKADEAWADYAIPNYKKVVWPGHVIVADFADGQRVRMSFASLPGKPINIGRGVRMALAAYELRLRTAKPTREELDRAFDAMLEGRAVARVQRAPVFASVTIERQGETVATYDAADVNARVQA